MKTSAFVFVSVALFATGSVAEESQAPVPPKTFTLSEATAADYAQRLRVEMQQIAAQYAADAARLKEMADQATATDHPPARAPAPETKPK